MALEAAGKGVLAGSTAAAGVTVMAVCSEEGQKAMAHLEVELAAVVVKQAVVEKAEGKLVAEVHQSLIWQPI